MRACNGTIAILADRLEGFMVANRYGSLSLSSTERAGDS